ncbi:MAG: hypothetical protein AAGK17_06200 [Pseudomonadota bacterium]
MMLAVVGVVALGGSLVVGAFDSGSIGSPKAEQSSEDKTSEISKIESADTRVASTTFEDMLGDDIGEDEDGGFASSTPDDSGDVQDGGGFATPSFDSPEASESAGPKPSNPFGSSTQTRASQKTSKRIISNANGKVSKPIPVDASRVSPSVGGKGKGVPGEID